MKASEVIDHINNIEATIPVTSWKIDGVDVWPIIRLKLYFYLTRVDLQLPPDNPGSFIKKSLFIIKKHVKYALLFFKSSSQGKMHQSDIIFLADRSYIEKNGKLYQRFCDPIIADVINRGIKSFTISTIKKFSKDLWNPAFFNALQVQLICDYVRFIQVLGLSSVNMSSLDGWKNFVAYVEEIEDKKTPFPLEKIKWDFLILKRLIKHYSNILNKIKPKFAFVVSYYDGGQNNMAFVYACKKMGIATIDLQHGTINELHGAYGRWHQIPVQGYNTLPNYFACWDKQSADCINLWASNHSQYHKALVLGNQFMQLVAEEESIFKNYFENIKLTNNPKRNMLLTLQVECGFPDILKEILFLSPQSNFWWIRFHPMMTQFEKENAVSIISQMDNLNYNISEVSEALLYHVLPHMDVHVTLNSSVVQEASQFGVPSILCDETGHEYFKAEIDRGQAFKAENAGEVIHLIGSIQSHKIMPERISSDNFYKEIGLYER